MNLTPSAQSSLSALRRVIWLSGAAWVLVTSVSMGWHLWGEREQALEFARTAARAGYEKDLLYRRWATGHGGVYVTPTAKTPPNPYLTMIPDRDVVTTDGRKLTLINPAYMTRQVFDMANPGITRARLTSLTPLRPGNAPDPWERDALLALAAGKSEVSETSVIDGADHIRLIRPMLVEPGCLKCHEHQGYRVGDLRGGLSISVPLAPYYAAQRAGHLGTVLLHLGFGGLGLAGLAITHRRLRTSIQSQSLAEAAMLVAERRWQVAVESSGDGLWDWNVATGDVYYSPRWQSMLGYGPHELPHRFDTWQSLVHPDDLPRALEEVRRYVAGESKVLHLEHRLRCKDGRYRWILGRGSVAERSPEGHPTRLLGMHTDITDRRRAERRQQKDAEQMRLLLELFTESPHLPEKQVFDRMMAVAARLTDSRVGMVYWLDEDETTIGLTLWAERALAGTEEAVETRVPLQARASWDEFVRGTGPRVDNDFSPASFPPGIPSGPAPLRRLMTIPVVEAGRKRLVIGVADKVEDYTEEDGSRLMIVGAEMQKIFAQRRAERTLAASETAFRTMFAHNPNPMWVIRRTDFRFLAVNDAALRLYGYTREEFLRLTSLDIRPPEERDRLVRSVRGAVNSYTSDGIWRHIKKSGEELRVQVSSQSVVWEGYDARSVLVVDVTDREQVIERLGQSEHHLALAMDLAHAAHWQFELSTRRFMFNDRFYALYGTTAEREGGYEMPAETYAREFLPPEEQSMVADEIARVIQAGDPSAHGSLEHTVLRRDGARRHFMVHLSVVTDAAGRIIGSRGVNQDITERREAADALRQRERDLDLFFSQSLDGFFFMMLDEPLRWDDSIDKEAALDRAFQQQRITRANQAFLNQYGATREQMIGRTPAELLAHDLVAGRAVWRKFFDAGRLHVETDERRLDGARIWIEGDYLCLYDSAGRITGHFGVQRDITERKQAEFAFAQSQLSLQQALEFGRMGAWDYDLATRMFTFNDQIYRLYGTTVEREGGYVMPGRRFRRELFFPDDFGVLAAQWKRVHRARRGEEWTVEHRIRRRDGEVRHHLQRVTVQSNAAGKVVGIRGVSTDITERVQAEAERRRLARAVEQSPVTVVITDPSGAIEYANPQFTRSTGYSLAEVLGQNPRVLKSGAQPPEVYRELWATIASGREWRGDLCNRRKDGTLYWEEVSISPVLAEDGRVTHYLAIKEDITERRATMEKLRDQAALLDVTRDVIIVTDLEGTVTYWNRGAEHIYGWTAAESLGRSLATLLYDAAHPAPMTTRDAILTTGEWSGELRQCTKAGGTVLVRARGVLMRDSVGMPRSIFLTGTDITDAKRLEGQLLRSQRLESIGSLASGVAHDLNNVLSPIMMAIELLRPIAVTPGDRDLLRLMSDSARRGADVLRQLLLFGRGTEAPNETIDVTNVVKEVLRMMRETFPRNVVISGECPRDLWPICGHATQVYQVLLNLCVNARDAMPGGGRLSLIAANRVLTEEFARENVDARPGRFVEISVIDTGTGIPPEIIHRIFDPFFTTKEQGKGTGLGLSTALGIVRSHQGFITISSHPGRGTEFRIYLPGVADTREVSSVSALPRLVSGHGETVLVVDDETSIRQILKRSLEDAQYRVVTATNGEEALAVVRARHGELRAMVLDMMMPGIEGLALVAALREITPTLPIVACSGLDHYGRELSARGFSHVAFLSKPFTVDRVLLALRSAIDRPPGSP